MGCWVPRPDDMEILAYSARGHGEAQRSTWFHEAERLSLSLTYALHSKTVSHANLGYVPIISRANLLQV